MNKYEIAGVSAGVLILAALFGWIFTAPYLSNQGLGRMPGLIIGGTLTEAPEDFITARPVSNELRALELDSINVWFCDSILLFSVTNAMTICLDTFIAKSARSTKYIIPIIFFGGPVLLLIWVYWELFKD